MRRQPISEPLDRYLPTEALYKGYGLTWWSPAAFEVDPVILYKHNEEVYRWDYIPSMIEVWEKVKKLEKQ